MIDELRQKRAAVESVKSVDGLVGCGYSKSEAILMTMQATLDGIALLLQDIKASLEKE